MSDPYVGKLTYFRVYSGQAQGRRPRPQHDHRQDRAHQPHPPDAREPPRGARGDRRGRDRSARRPQEHDDGRHARDRHRADRARVDDVPRSGDLGRRRAEDEGRPGQARPGPAAPRRGGSRPSACGPTRRPARRSSPAWASCTSRSSSTASSASSTSTRTSAGRRSPTARRSTSRSRRVQGKFVRQTGGRGQYGHAVINLEPPSQGAGYEFVDKIVGGKIPKEYIPSVDLGIQEAMESGILAGYPVVDIRVELVEGSYHDVDSSEMAFKVAGLDGVQGGHEAREAEAARADDGGRGRHARGVPRRRHGQPQLPPRPGRAPRAARQRPVDQGEGAARGDVRLRHRPALDDAGSGHVHDAVRPLRGSPAVDRHRARRRAEA